MNRMFGCLCCLLIGLAGMLSKTQKSGITTKAQMFFENNLFSRIKENMEIKVLMLQSTGKTLPGAVTFAKVSATSAMNIERTDQDKVKENIFAN